MKLLKNVDKKIKLIYYSHKTIIWNNINRKSKDSCWEELWKIYLIVLYKM